MKTPITPGEILLGSAPHASLKRATDQHGWTPMKANETAQAPDIARAEFFPRSQTPTANCFPTHIVMRGDSFRRTRLFAPVSAGAKNILCYPRQSASIRG